LQSSILDYARGGDPVGLLPTLAADALYHKKIPPVRNLDKFLRTVGEFAVGSYKPAKEAYPKVDPKVLNRVLDSLSKFIGIPREVLKYWKLDPATPDVTLFLTSLLTDTRLEGKTVGAFDGRATAEDTGIAASIIKSNDPAMAAIGGVYTTMWNAYLNNELQFTSTTPFMAQNNRVFPNWNFGHIDPTGAEKGDPTGAQRGRVDNLYTAGDLAAAMELNPYLKVFSANGYYDAVTPFFQTQLNFDHMPCSKKLRDDNLKICNYKSGHMIYLDNESRRLMKEHLAKFYECAIRREKDDRIGSYTYTRHIGRTPY
jgi:carboxypeptidase C (cathepsin A)